MSMKQLVLSRWLILSVVVFGLGLVNCNREQPLPIQKEFDKREDIPSVNPTPDPPVPGPTPSPAPEQEGVYIMLEPDVVVAGQSTRTVWGDGDYNVTPYGIGEDGDVQVEGLGFITKSTQGNEIVAQLSFHAKGNVGFYGWSWRYGDDPRNTHRDERGQIISDFIKVPFLQTRNGLQKLGINSEKLKLTCKYRAQGNNKVYIKIRYNNNKDGLRDLPKAFDFSSLRSLIPDKKDKTAPSSIQEIKSNTQELLKMLDSNEDQYNIVQQSYIIFYAFPSSQGPMNYWIDKEGKSSANGKVVNQAYYGISRYYQFSISIFDYLEHTYIPKLQYLELKLVSLITKIGFKSDGKDPELGELMTDWERVKALREKVEKTTSKLKKQFVEQWWQELEYYREKGV